MERERKQDWFSVFDVQTGTGLGSDPELVRILDHLNKSSYGLWDFLVCTTIGVPLIGTGARVKGFGTIFEVLTWGNTTVQPNYKVNHRKSSTVQFLITNVKSLVFERRVSNR